MTTRWGMTVPLGGVALADHAAAYAAPDRHHRRLSAAALITRPGEGRRE
ncbi:hypothetical protein [Micromonospora sp. KC606]|nr:hypothetical protein [Micromonospora sp. KC606]